MLSSAAISASARCGRRMRSSIRSIFGAAREGEHHAACLSSPRAALLCCNGGIPIMRWEGFAAIVKRR